MPNGRLSKKIPAVSSLYLSKTEGRSVLKLESKTEFKSAIIYFKDNSIWKYELVPCENSEIEISPLQNLITESGNILISFVDRFGQVSKPALFNIGL